MKTTLTLLIVIFFIDLVSAQNLVLFYQRPELALTEYQKLYAENLVKDTKTYQLKGNVKSVTMTLLDRDMDPLTIRDVVVTDYLETYQLEFLSNQKLQSYEKKMGRKYNGNTEVYSNINTITYSFDEENNKLLKTTETYNKKTTEKEFDSLGFLKQETAYRIDIEGKHTYHIKNYKWNKKQNVANYHFYHYSPDAESQGKLLFKGENYKRTVYSDTLIAEGFLMERYKTTGFDERGNIVIQTSYEPDNRSSLPNSYTFSYKYNENNELIEITRRGSTSTQFFNNSKTTFKYKNYDEYGNWQEMTINSTDDNKRYTILKYKLKILYY